MNSKRPNKSIKIFTSAQLKNWRKECKTQVKELEKAEIIHARKP
jgi:hypothetical protein